jgi:ribokinase
MAERPTVLVVGSINVDLTVHADRLPAPGETVAGGRLERAGGGKGANQAVAAARAGAGGALVAAVGDDDFGAGALAELRSEGVAWRPCSGSRASPRGSR